MPRKPKRITVTHVIVENVDLTDRPLETLFDDLEIEFGSLTGYDNVRFSIESYSEYSEDGTHTDIIGDKPENDREYEIRIGRIARAKEMNRKKNQTKLEKITTQMAKLEKENKELRGKLKEQVPDNAEKWD